MKRVLHVLTYLTIVLLFLSVRTNKAQGVIQSWDFEVNKDIWNSGDGTPTLSISTDQAYTHTHSLKVVAAGTGTNATIQNDGYKPQSGDVISYRIWVAAADTAQLSDFQVFFQDGGSAWSWHSLWIDRSSPQWVKGGQWNTISYTLPTIAPTLDRFGLQLQTKTNVSVTYYIDAITVYRASSLVSQWGSTSRGAAWPIIDTLTTPAGSASMGNGKAPTGWSSLRGDFDLPLTATTSQAVVVTGTLEFVGGGGGSSYTWLRYAIMGDDAPVLTNQFLPTAIWSNGANPAGYEFDPVSGTGTLTNGSGGGTGASGTLWLVKNSAWTSTNSNGGGPLSTVMNAPFRAVASAGVYNWAISIQPKSDGTNEIRYYLEKQHAAGTQTTYWFGGTSIDPKPSRTTFNYVAFGINSDIDATTKQINLANVTAVLGSPITVTEAPFQSFYVNQWGTTPRGSNWPILNDSTYIDGNGSMGGTKAPAGWASIRGGFQQSVIPTLTKAMVVTGSFEFVGGGGGSSYTWLRYAIMGDSGAVLSNQNKPTAAWTEGAAKRGGYEWDPVSGSGQVANGSGGGSGASGTMWLVKNSSSWTSTNSNGGGPIGGIVLPAPARAIATAGVYDWAISVQPLADGTNQIRYYFQKHAATGAQTTYWFGGTAIDPNPVQKAFNYIGFAVNSDIDATCKQVNITNVKVDLTDPIKVTEAPWQAYYISSWGFFGGKNGGGWKYTTDGIVGDGSIVGTKSSAGWAAIRGGFVSSVIPTTSKAVVIKGNMELVGGGFEAWSSLNFGLFYCPNPGSVDTSAGLSSAKWTGTDKNEYGYLITPRSAKLPNETYGMTDMATVGAIVNEPWLSTSGTSPFDTANHNYIVSSNIQNPANAVGTAGMYNFAVSIQPLANGNTEIRYDIEKQDKTYAFAGTVIDTKNTGKITQFNGIHFATNNPTTTALNLTNVLVDYGAPITITNSYALTSTNSNGNGIPANFELSQNYPNPFNPTTNIQFSLPKNSNVKLVVYDILGRVVSQLIDKDLTAGNYKINFNASNLASGTYFYSLHAGDFVSVKKLMLVK
jgi:hypothetical protein